MGAISDKYNLEIDGLGYTLARQPRTNRPIYKRGEAPSFVNKMSTGDPSYRDASFWSAWVQINWQNGAKSEQFNDQARFNYDSGINVHEEGRVQLSPKLEDTGLIPSAGSVGTVCACTDGWWGGLDLRLFAGNGLGGLYEANSSLSAWTEKYVIGNPPITALYDYNDIWVGSGVGSASTCEGIIYRISASGVFDSSAAIGANDGINVITDSTIGGTQKLYVGTTRYTSGGGSLNSTIDNVSSFTEVWNSNVLKITTITEYMDKMVIGSGYPIGDPTSPYQGALNLYDGTSVTKLIDLPHTVPLAAASFDNMLFVGSAHGHLYVYNGSSFDLLFKFWGNDIDMKINRLWVHQDKLYIEVSKDSALKNSDTKYAGIWTFNRRGLNLDYKQDAGTTSAYSEITSFRNQLIFTAGNGGQAWKVNETLFQVSGALQSSYFDANLPSIDKLFKETTIIYDYLSANTSATISYKTDETESFTDLGTAKTEGSTSATFQFPSALAKKKICYQVLLSTGNVSATPRVKKIVEKYTVMPEFYHQWNFGIDTSEKIQLLDGSFHPSSGLQLESALFTSKRNKQTVIFKDVDYVSTTLVGAIAASAGTINVTDASRMPPKGRLRIPTTGEELLYGSRTSTTLNTVTRGYKNTVAVSAANLGTIDMSYQVMFQGMDEEQFSLNQLADQYQNITPVRLLET